MGWRVDGGMVRVVPLWLSSEGHFAVLSDNKVLPALHVRILLFSYQGMPWG